MRTLAERGKRRMNSDATSTVNFAARCFVASRVIHWITVALVCGLLVSALSAGIDSHGAGNTAFLWHSSMGIVLYLLSISRVLLWLIYRPHAPSADASAPLGALHRGMQIAFYALLVAAPISGWVLASEEGASAHVFGIPALPQWYFQEPARQAAAIHEAHARGAADPPLIVDLIRIHAVLAAALFLVIVLHVVTVIRERALRAPI